MDGSLGDSFNFTVLGKITGPVMEIPGTRRTNMAWGWVVEPEALYIDGRIVATFDAQHEKSGSFVEEAKVAGIKEGWYTEKDVPDNATPERVMEIFLASIKEKNYPLYRKCINHHTTNSSIYSITKWIQFYTIQPLTCKRQHG